MSVKRIMCCIGLESVVCISLCVCVCLFRMLYVSLWSTSNVLACSRV